MSAPTLGRPKLNITTEEKEQAHDEKCDRVEIEHCIYLAKHKYGMGKINTIFKETAIHVIATVALSLNFRRILRALICILTARILIAANFSEIRFVQLRLLMNNEYVTFSGFYHYLFDWKLYSILTKFQKRKLKIPFE